MLGMNVLNRRVGHGRRFRVSCSHATPYAFNCKLRQIPVSIVILRGRPGPHGDAGPPSAFGWLDDDSSDNPPIHEASFTDRQTVDDLTYIYRSGSSSRMHFAASWSFR